MICNDVANVVFIRVNVDELLNAYAFIIVQAFVFVTS